MKCNHKNENYLRFCQTCGDKLDNFLCSCGFSNKVDSQFCGMCGKSVRSLAESLNDSGQSVMRFRHHIEKPNLKKLLQELDITSIENDSASNLNQDAIEGLFKGKQ